MKARDGTTKWLLHQVLSRYVPTPLTSRPKMGFNVPLADWIRYPLRSWAVGLLDKRGIIEDGFFDPIVVAEKLRQHMTADFDWHAQLWNLLVFQSWRQTWRRHIAAP
jgi:asparagine synthase (glutamine-hydrolysing)